MSHAPAVSTLLLSVVMLFGCAARYDLQTSEPAMAADAHLVIKKNKTGTYEVSLQIMHLPPADRLGKFSVYAVWVVAGEANPVKAGLLNYNDRKRSAELEFSTPRRKFDVLVTLEKSPTSNVPGRTAIIEQSVKARD